MNRTLIKKYVDKQSIKIVTNLDLSANKIVYDKIVQGRIIKEITGDEEMSRAFILTRLVNELGYAAERIEIEHEYTAGRPHTNTSRIDIIVRDSKGDAFLFIEAKSPDEYASVDKDKTIEEQLYKVSFMENAEGHKVKYLVLYTTSEAGGKVSDECMIIDTEAYPTYADWETDRNYTNELPSRYGKAQHKPYVKDSDKDLETSFTGEMLNQLQTNLHNVLWGGGGTDDNEVFASLVNLILAKIQDEDTTESGELYRFQSLTFEKEGDEEFETNEQLFERINMLYREALKSKLYILNEDELAKSYVIDSKKFSLSKLKYAVQQMEGLSFVDGKNSLNGKDILGNFFEGIIRNGFKQNKGQFFTHINIVRFMLWAIQADRLAISRIKKDKEIPYMIDPSAGSGTFLIEYMRFITENMKYRFRSELGSARAIKDKIEDWFYPDHRENRWAQTYIYASESNFNLGTATKVNMILHGDGSTNIFVKDGLLPFSHYEKELAPNVMHDSSDESLYYDKAINGNFDLILTNPPFSVELDNDTKKSIKKSFVFGDKKNSENLFIERWYQLLRENGRLAAVLPESVFDTTENKYIRLFLYKYFTIKAVVSLPQLAFEPYTSTKTSLLFAQKKTTAEVTEWNKAWDEASKDYSKLKTRTENLIAVHDGLKEKKKLPSIKDMSAAEEKEVLVNILKDYITEKDFSFTADDLIEKYRSELRDLCTIDKDTFNSFGPVNTWWVFGKVAKKFNYNIFMAEVDNIGYKRTKRGEREMPNELFELEYAPLKLDVLAVEKSYNSRISALTDVIAAENRKKEKEKNADKIAQFDQKILELDKQKSALEAELAEVKKFISVYYDDNELKEEYRERIDSTLIAEFRSGRLQKYCSEAIALHSNTYNTILDYMRDINWE